MKDNRHEEMDKVHLLEEQIELSGFEVHNDNTNNNTGNKIDDSLNDLDDTGLDREYLDDLIHNKGYKRVAGSIPKTAYLICIIELAERASYYGITGCLTNFIQRPLPTFGDGTVSLTGSVIDAGHHSHNDLVSQSAGALGLGLQLANFTVQFMTFVAYLSPVFGGYISDSRIGKLRSIWIGIYIGIIGHILLVIAAMPFMLHRGKTVILLSYGLTLISLCLIALSAGFIKPNLLPLLLDQYKFDKDIVIPSKLEIWDYDLTLNKLSLVFYWCINIGCIFAILTSYIEQRMGFYSAFLVPGLIYFVVLPFLLWWIQNGLTEKRSSQNGKKLFDEIIPLLKLGFSKGWLNRILNNEFWNYITTEFNKDLTKSLRKTVDACFIFLYFIVFNLNDGSITSLQVSLMGETNTNGIPNDFYYNLNPISIIIFIPIFDKFINPIVLRKWLKIDLKPQTKIFTGFMLSNIGTLFGIVLQILVYTKSPCGWIKTSECDKLAEGINGNFFGFMMFGLQALGEVFSTVTAYELAYSYSSPEMKSICMALFLMTNSISAIIGEILGLFGIDPFTLGVFIFCFVSGLANALKFYTTHVNKTRE